MTDSSSNSDPQPPAGLPPDESRVAVAAHLQPASDLGGDLLDWCRLDAHRLYALIGDVSGKGAGVAEFAERARTACRGAVRRHPQALDRALAEAEAALCRHNPRALFVTAFVLLLDLRSGELVWSNAGHEPLYALRAGRVRRIDHAGRPPLCVTEGARFPVGRERLEPGEQLCLVTDGVTESRDPSGALYGHARLQHFLAGVTETTPERTLAGLQAELGEFRAGRDQADDLSVLVLRWSGPLPAPRQARFPARAEALVELRRFVEEAGFGLGADAAATLRIALVAEELFLNCVLHGYRGEPGSFELRLDALDDELRLVAEDAAPAFDPFDAVSVPDPEEGRIGGLGRALIAGLATRHRYQRVGERNRVTIHMLRHVG